MGKRWPLSNDCIYISQLLYHWYLERTYASNNENLYFTASVTEYLSQMTVGPSAVDRLVKAAAQGQTDEVQDILAQSPDIVSVDVLVMNVMADV